MKLYWEYTPRLPSSIADRVSSMPKLSGYDPGENCFKTANEMFFNNALFKPGRSN